MEQHTDTSTSTYWNVFITETFTKVWEDLTPVDLTKYACQIRDHYNLEHISARIQFEIEGSADRETAENDHMRRLKVLVRFFIEYLLELSNNGENITQDSIAQAKKMILHKDRCVYES